MVPASPARGVSSMSGNPAPRARVELASDVRGLEADVVQSLAALLEELCHAARGVDGFEELDLAAPDRQQGRLHALVRDRGLLRHLQPERVLPEGEPVLQAAHHEPDVMDAGEHRSAVSTRRVPRAARRCGRVAQKVRLANPTVMPAEPTARSTRSPRRRRPAERATLMPSGSAAETVLP